MLDKESEHILGYNVRVSFSERTTRSTKQTNSKPQSTVASSYLGSVLAWCWSPVFVSMYMIVYMYMMFSNGSHCFTVFLFVLCLCTPAILGKMKSRKISSTVHCKWLENSLKISKDNSCAKGTSIIETLSAVFSWLFSLCVCSYACSPLPLSPAVSRLGCIT